MILLLNLISNKLRVPFERRPYIIEIDNQHFRVGDVIKSASGGQNIVVKVYKKRWWKKLLALIGIKFRTTGIKVVYYGV